MTSTRRSFCLAGPSTDFDPRVQAVRADLADVALAGILFAPHYAEPVTRQCQATTAILDKPEGKQVSELLTGEHFALLDVSGGWAWGWSVHDHYVGYVKADALAPASGDLPAIASGDPVEIARAFLDMPYLWGGRGEAGIDCSGLVQRSVAGLGVSAPRDSDMQAASLGTALADGETLQRGDFVFFPGHVGMMTDSETLIHATRHHGKVVEEPLADVIARIAAKREGVSIVGRRRVIAT